MNTTAHSTKNVFNLTAVLMSLLLLVSLSGCGSSSSAPDSVVSFTDAAVVEGDTGTVDLVFTASLDKSSNSVINITYSTADITAIAGTDYMAATGTLQIPAGASSVAITIAVNGDTDIEADETLTLNLSKAVGATLATSSVVGTITNDDHANPSAYYTGSATVISPIDLTGNAIRLADLRVMISGNRMIMMNTVQNDGERLSPEGAQTIFYDATNLVMNGNDFTADLTIYINMHRFGEKIQSTISGTITETGGIVGTIGTVSDTAAGTGTFEVLYSSLSDTSSALVAIADKRWGGVLNGLVGSDIKATYGSNGEVIWKSGTNFKSLGGIFRSCRYTGAVTPIPFESLYAISIDFYKCADFSQDSTQGGTYTGFAMPVLVNDKETMVFAMSNSVASAISILTIVP